MATASGGERAGIGGRYAVAGIFLINGFLMGSFAPQIPFLLPRHRIGETVLGLLILLIGVGAVTAMSWTGWLISRHGPRRLIVGFGIGASLALSAVVVSPNLALVAPALLLFGACIGSMDVAMNANAVEVERRLNRAVMSSSHGFWSLGGFIGGGAGGVLIARLGAGGHALATSAIALAGVLAATPFLLPDAGHHPKALRKTGYTWPKAPAVYILGAITLFAMIPEGAVLDWAALYLGKDLNAGVSASGLGFALFSGAMAVMRFAGDGLRNRFGAVATFKVSGCVACAGLFGSGLAPDTALAIAAFGVAGLGMANLVPIALSAAGNQPGLSAGAGLSVVAMMGYSGILVAPSAIGYAAERTGYRPIYVALALLLAAVTALAPRVAAADRATIQAPDAV